MVWRIAIGGSLLAALAGAIVEAGPADGIPLGQTPLGQAPLGQLMRPAGGPILDYPQREIAQLNSLARGPIRFNPQDALQGTTGRHTDYGPIGQAPNWATHSTTRQSIQRRSGSRPARPMNPK